MSSFCRARADVIRGKIEDKIVLHLSNCQKEVGKLLEMIDVHVT